MSDFVLHGTSCTEFTRKMNKDLQQAVQVKITLKKKLFQMYNCNNNFS